MDTTHGYEQCTYLPDSQAGARRFVAAIHAQLRKLRGTARAPKRDWVTEAARLGLAEAIDDISYTYERLPLPEG